MILFQFYPFVSAMSLNAFPPLVQDSFKNYTLCSVALSLQFPLMWEVFQPLFLWVLFLPHSPSPLFPETSITCYVSLFCINPYLPEVLFFSNIFFFSTSDFPQVTKAPFLSFQALFSLSFRLATFILISHALTDLSCHLQSAMKSI